MMYYEKMSPVILPDGEMHKTKEYINVEQNDKELILYCPSDLTYTVGFKSNKYFTLKLETIIDHYLRLNFKACDLFNDVVIVLADSLRESNLLQYGLDADTEKLTIPACDDLTEHALDQIRIIYPVPAKIRTSP